MSDLADRIRLDDPSWYRQDDAHDLLDEARRVDPVLYFEDFNTFLLTRYEDIRYVSRTPEIYSSAHGITLNDAKYGDITHSFFPEGAELITATDPPRHRELRRVIQPTFAPRAIADMEPRIRANAIDLVARIKPGEEIDVVDQIAVPLPIHTICAVLGIESVPVDHIRSWTDDVERMGGDLSKAELAEVAQSLVPLNEFLVAALEAKRGCTGADLISTLLQAEIDNEKLRDINILMLTTATLVAGNGTTRSLIGNTIDTLAAHPRELDRLVSDPSLCASAITEVLRFTAPVPGFLRTVTSDTVLNGTRIRRGQHVYMCYGAANRDPSVFSDPHRFDVGRDRRPVHLSFGSGEHACPGNFIARLEVQVLLNELVTRFVGWEVGADPVPVMSIMTNAYERLPVTFHTTL
ncbi:cytochrome P450 [Actinomadura rugatobispora]|uniref:Cytochrome P450 n=1 Tax=Actinomadura rugatobispora TaxID=1994 RepID=A0ABW0ZQ16_9ACTN|nr:cytochrome P450 [Actinomadura rugatobispora]